MNEAENQIGILFQETQNKGRQLFYKLWDRCPIDLRDFRDSLFLNKKYGWEAIISPLFSQNNKRFTIAKIKGGWPDMATKKAAILRAEQFATFLSLYLIVTIDVADVYKHQTIAFTLRFE
jgi:hypothetical protein